jgi:hypothetical protein
MDKTQKGYYYLYKTKRYLEKRGWKVQKLEVPKVVFFGGKKVITHTDLWGADLIAIKGKRIAIIQNRTNKVDILPAIKNLEKQPWPNILEKWVVYWEKNSRTPTIIDIKTKKEIKINEKRKNKI